MKKVSKNVLMLYPSISEIEQKCDEGPFWRSEWKRVKEDIGDFKAFIAYVVKTA